MRNGFRLPRALAAGMALGAAVGATGCQAFGPAATPPPPWHYTFELTVHGHPYRVTHHTVPRVGRKVAVVAYQGTPGPVAPSGVYAIYSIPGVPVVKEVAVDARQGYIEAVRVAAASR